MRSAWFVLVLGAAAWPGSAPAATRQTPGGFEPEVSANALFLAGYTKREDPDGAPTSRTGLFAQQVELHVAAPVDTGLFGRITLALPRGSRTEDRVDITEAYVTLRLSGLGDLAAGRFYAAFGRHNLLHPHQFPFLDRPLVLERMFGVDGISEVGFGLRRSLPALGRVAVTAQVLNGDNPRWVNPTDEDLLYLLHLERRWGEDAARGLRLGASWAGGRNPTERWTHALGADVTVSWARGRWQTEYVRVSEDLKRQRRTTGGVTSYLRYRLSRRWWAQARYGYYGLPRETGTGWEDRATVLFAFVPGDRARLRFQYSRWRLDDLRRGFNQYHLQLDFRLGSRPARGQAVPRALGAAGA